MTLSVLRKGEQPSIVIPRADDVFLSTKKENGALIVPDSRLSTLGTELSNQEPGHFWIRVHDASFRIAEGVYLPEYRQPISDDIVKPSTVRFRGRTDIPPLPPASDRRALGASQAYAPSVHLIEIVRSGLQAQVEAARDAKTMMFHVTPSQIDSVTSLDLSSFILNKIDTAFAGLANIAKQQSLREVPLGANGEFNEVGERALFEALPMRLRDVYRVATYVYEDISSYLISGGMYALPWGRLVLQDQKLLLIVSATRSILAPMKVKTTIRRVEK